jgi:hypothetical protein
VTMHVIARSVTGMVETVHKITNIIFLYSSLTA